MSVTAINGQNFFSSGSCSNCDKLISLTELCWDDETYNECGKSASMVISAEMNELDTRIGDSRIKINFPAIHTPIANVVSDVTVWEYQNPFGQTVTGTGQFFCNDIFDLIGTEENNLVDYGYTLTKVSVSNISGTKKRIKLHGSLTINELDTLLGTFFMLRKTATIVNGQYNPNEIVFFKQACSNFVQGNGFVTFDYDMNFNSNVNAYQFWIEQTQSKLKLDWLQKNVTTWEQVIRYNRVPNDSFLDITRTIIFSNGCPTKVIKKRINITKAKYPFITTAGLVNTPIELNIVNL